MKAVIYHTRKSPFHANQHKKLTKKSKVSSKKTRKTSKGASYLINDNGNRPFKVEVSGNIIRIYSGKRIDDGTDDYDIKRKYNTLIQKLTVHKIYPGESPCELALISGFDCGKDSIGNSVLLHLSGSTYMFVGSEIYKFTMTDDFDAYYSAIGLNSVSNQDLLGSKYVYFMLDHVYVPRDAFPIMTAIQWADAYAYFYGIKDPMTGRAYINKKHKTTIQKESIKMKGYLSIQKRI